MSLDIFLAIDCRVTTRQGCNCIQVEVVVVGWWFLDAGDVHWFEDSLPLLILRSQSVAQLKPEPGVNRLQYRHRRMAGRCELPGSVLAHGAGLLLPGALFRSDLFRQ